MFKSTIFSQCNPISYLIYKKEILMPAYQLQIKQVVDYPRCRIYRQFVRFLMEDRSIRVSGGSGLFNFTVGNSPPPLPAQSGL